MMRGLEYRGLEYIARFTIVKPGGEFACDRERRVLSCNLEASRFGTFIR